ncbi:MAG TPA: bifunctional phosphoribosylaminoimidazolecarboxamide formyltransferase/IMP cyclohydrolase, partial [Blastocatellia bacterium]|nr:bifunctional phosphoribosylaminoimidazolecarboxamide formyltransferase/IMP cyclohydrolase [Blastocatellia bacterium]
MGKIRRALISVSHKEGLVEFGRKLCSHSIELVSTGGTARALREAGLPVRDVSELTGFPEMLDGRVKTLHPRVHGGILAVRDDPEHRRQTEEQNIQFIDMVVVNLYPFRETVAREGVTVETAIENIDIGGPSMIRSAAKNFRDVVVIVDPSDYAVVAGEMDTANASVSLSTRLRLARRAFEITARYDAAITEFLTSSVQLSDENSLAVETGKGLPAVLAVVAPKESDLRYGENPHQRAALYVPDTNAAGIATSEKLQGKELSYNNLIDLDAAWLLVSDLGKAAGTACAIVKHTNPCGAATGSTSLEAFQKARSTDPVSAFGGIIGINTTVTEETARAIVETFFEAIVAPDYEPGALEVLGSKKNLRVTRIAPTRPAGTSFEIKTVSGGFLVQDRDRGTLDDCPL